MKSAVTNHAVDRFIDRVKGAKGFEREAVREIIRKIVDDGFSEGAVRPHPLEKDRRVIPFKSGDSILLLSIGPNTTSFEDADIAVISVLFEHEVTQGKVGMDVKLEDVTDLNYFQVVYTYPRFIVRVGDLQYYADNEEGLETVYKSLGEQARKKSVVYELRMGKT